MGGGLLVRHGRGRKRGEGNPQWVALSAGLALTGVLPRQPPGVQGTYVVMKCLSVLVWRGVVLVFASGC